MAEYDQKLTAVLEHLSDNWQVKDYQPAGMGWAAVLVCGQHVVTLHSERGWVDVYKGRFAGSKFIASMQHSTEIAEMIRYLKEQ